MVSTYSTTLIGASGRMNKRTVIYVPSANHRILARDFDMAMFPENREERRVPAV